MAQTLMRCPHCGGTGKSPLDQAQEKTLAVLSKTAWFSTKEVFEKLADPYITEPTAVNNRLTKLKELGLAVSERRAGKLLYWRRVK